MKLVLASTSRIRSELLSKAGVTFAAVRPEVDENALKKSFKTASPGDLAQSLAAAKSVSLANRMADTLVIGADQVLNLEGKVFDKPASKDEARRHLEALRGRRHILETAVCCARGDKVIWRHLGRATLTMRNFSDAFLSDYLDRTEDDVTTSVGAYKLEGLGAQLFETIEGDYFTILGLPLLPLLDFLRQDRVLAA